MEEKLKAKDWYSDKELGTITPFSQAWYQKQRWLAGKGETYAGPNWQRFGNRCFYHRDAVLKYFEPVQSDSPSQT